MTQRSPHISGQKPRYRKGGFKMASGLLETRIREASESRGFAVTRLLTHWADIVGEDTARVARPVEIRYGRGNLGATLTILTTGAQAPMLEMSKQKIIQRVNACYGYSAICRIRLTQTAPTGFAEGGAAFGAAPARPRTPDPEVIREAAETAAPVADAGLRSALEALAKNVLSANKSRRG